MSAENLTEILDKNAETAVGKIKTWSSRPEKKSEFLYQDIKQASLRFSLMLHDQGIKQGDRIMLWGSNSPEWVIAYFGALKSGAAVVPFDVNRDPEFLSKVVQSTNPRFIIAGEAQRKTVPENNAVPIINIEGVSRVPEVVNYKTALDVSRSDIAEIVFTSGTTGNPKGVVLNHGNILSNVEAIQKVVEIKPDYKLLSILPLSHMFETTVGLLTPINSGAGITYIDTLQPSSILTAMQDERITCMAVVPEALKLFKKGIEQYVTKSGKEREFNFMRRLSPKLPELLRRIMFKTVQEKMGGNFEFFVCGGARLDPLVADFWEDLGIKVLQGYGMTEASPVVSCDTMEERDHRYVGYPLPGVEVKITEDGEVLVKGANVMQGYFNNKAATERVLEGEWYHTGDLGSMDEGKLKLVGRKGNMIVLSNGLNVYPEDIEEILSQQNAESVVFSKHIGEKEELHAVLLLKDSKSDPKDIVNSANKHLSSHQRIQGWTVWPDEDFPRTQKLEAKRDEIIKKVTL